MAAACNADYGDDDAGRSIRDPFATVKPAEDAAESFGVRGLRTSLVVPSLDGCCFASPAPRQASCDSPEYSNVSSSRTRR
jgi:hypothetical protein